MSNTQSQMEELKQINASTQTTRSDYLHKILVQIVTTQVTTNFIVSSEGSEDESNVNEIMTAEQIREEFAQEIMLYNFEESDTESVEDIFVE